MTPPSYHQDLAAHPALTEAQIDIAVLKSQLSSVQTELTQVKATLDEVKTLLTEARGGWRAMMLLGGAAAAVGGVVTWGLTHLRFTP